MHLIFVTLIKLVCGRSARPLACPSRGTRPPSLSQPQSSAQKVSVLVNDYFSLFQGQLRLRQFIGRALRLESARSQALRLEQARGPRAGARTGPRELALRPHDQLYKTYKIDKEGGGSKIRSLEYYPLNIYTNFVGNSLN